MTASTAEYFASGFPFQSHSCAVPPSRTNAARAVGVACSTSSASMKLDLPDPFGPIKTLSDVRSIPGLSGANDRNPLSLIDCKNDMRLLLNLPESAPCVALQLACSW